MNEDGRLNPQQTLLFTAYDMDDLWISTHFELDTERLSSRPSPAAFHILYFTSTNSIFSFISISLSLQTPAPSLVL